MATTKTIETPYNGQELSVFNLFAYILFLYMYLQVSVWIYVSLYMHATCLTSTCTVNHEGQMGMHQKDFWKNLVLTISSLPSPIVTEKNEGNRPEIQGKEVKGLCFLFKDDVKIVFPKDSPQNLRQKILCFLKTTGRWHITQNVTEGVRPAHSEHGCK